MSDIVANEFPIWGLLPKKETGVTQFLTKYPDYDGRGIVIAIFDSGVDPGVPGLQTTSDGKRKIIERFDCSGAGDVDTSTVVQANDDVIVGLTGRKLTIPKTWKNPSGQFHIGVKNGYELYPSKLTERMETLSKEKQWSPHHKTALAEATRKLQEYESKHSASNNSSNQADKLVTKDLEAHIETLNNLEKKFKDVGPCYDCVVFHNGDEWQACLDTSEQGDLASATLLGDYSLHQQYGTLTKEDQFNYSVNVHHDGNLLEIVGLCSGHGTHVASIAAAYFPDEPEKNGVAPGAQIISLSLGDNRLGSMETGTAVVRSMIKVMQQTKDKPIHVINMSYGEHANWTSAGRIMELMSEVVCKYNVTWVSSAGNHGPALCTLTTPPDINTNTIIGVGAYVSPEMMVAEYSLREKLPGMPYTWTSRGPTINGGEGLSVCAPGAAITNVPSFTLRGTQLMNGTSMAAPHVSGAIAVLLSGLQQRNIPYSPHSVKRSLENTAYFQDSLDPYTQGCGLLQVEKAFEHLCQFSNAVERPVRFLIKCGMSGAMGIHMRNGLQNRPKECLVNIEPVFHEDSDHSEKINFNMKLCLTCSEPWVQIPTHLDLMNITRTITIRVDPTGLPEGLHTSSVRAYDVTCPEKGFVFRVPITVVRPTVVTQSPPDLIYSNVTFKPNTIKRHFILVPEKATWAVVRLCSADKDKTGKFMVHCMQLLPKQICKTLELRKTLTLSPHSEEVHPFAVRGGLVLEVVIAKYWANLGDMQVNYCVEFRGVKPDYPVVTMHGAEGVHTIMLNSGLRFEEILPIVTLKNTNVIVRPSESKITPLSSTRDVIPPGRQIYENVLSYTFHLAKVTELSPACPLLGELLYESEYESQLWMLFDCNKQLLATGDAYPSKYMVKLERGEYTLRRHVRHEKKEQLEKLTDIPVVLSLKLSTAVVMDVFVSHTQAMIGAKKMGLSLVPPGLHTLPVYIGPLTSDKGLKGITQGHFLTGTISYSKDELGKKKDVYPFKYILPEPPKKKNNNNNDKDKNKSKLDEYNEALRDLKVNWLAKLEPGEETSSLYEELKSAFPGHLPVHTAMMHCLEPLETKRLGLLPLLSKAKSLEEKEKEELIKTSRQIISIAEEVISAVDSAQLLAYVGMKNDTRPDASRIKSVMEKQKSALLDAYCRKGCALARLLQLKAVQVEGEETLHTINNMWREAVKFADVMDSKVQYLLMWHAAVHEHYGTLAKHLLRLQEEKPTIEVDEKLVEVYDLLGWHHCSKFLSKWLPVKYPPSYRLF